MAKLQTIDLFDLLRLSDWFPPLDKEYVAAKTVRAVLLNKRELIMPRIMHIFLFLKRYGYLVL